MRLDDQQIATVKMLVGKIAGRGATVRLFGSRLDDSARGGDLDLLVESEQPIDVLQRADLQWNLEQHLHLPVDLVFLEKEKTRTPFQELAYARSQLLA